MPAPYAEECSELCQYAKFNTGSTVCHLVHYCRELAEAMRPPTSENPSLRILRQNLSDQESSRLASAFETSCSLTATGQHLWFVP